MDGWLGLLRRLTVGPKATQGEHRRLVGRHEDGGLSEGGMQLPRSEVNKDHSELSLEQDREEQLP